jgi:hypothetical protein
LILLIFTLSFSLPFFNPPDSTELVIKNSLDEGSIVEVNLLIPRRMQLTPVFLSSPIAPGSEETVAIPYLFFNRIIFTVDNGIYYRSNGYAPVGDPAEITVSLAVKEFGGSFDRIFGNFPLVIRNSTPIAFNSVFFSGDSLPQGNLLTGQILMPDEFLRVWLDSGTTAEIFATDITGAVSSALYGIALPKDTTYNFTSELFYQNGNIVSSENEGSGSWVVNCLPDQRIITVEAFDSQGFFVDGIDCTSSPLQTWDRVFLPHWSPVAYIMCTDQNERTYSLMDPDSISGDYLFDMLSLDFGFGFPE